MLNPVFDGPGTLTSLTSIKEWLSIAGTESDTLLNRINAAVSRFVMSYLNRDTLAYRVRSEFYEGFGGRFMVVRNYPVIDVLSVSFLGTPLQKATGDGQTQPFSSGYILDTSSPVPRISFLGRNAPIGQQAIHVAYVTGYTTAEEYVVEGVEPTFTPSLMWLGGVTVQGPLGALERVSGTPSSGQYAVSADGVYAFSSTDAGDALSIEYSYVPADIEQAVWELVGSRFRYMDRIGYSSKSLGGQETVSFAPNKMDEYTSGLLAPFKRVSPA
jgi:hypothetical protein